MNTNLEVGNHYNWKYQTDRLVYLGKEGSWSQFALVGKTEIWCEVLDSDLHMLEEIKSIEWRADKVNPEEVRQALQQVQFTNHDNGNDTVSRELISASRYAIEALQRRVEELEFLNEWKVCDENTPIDTELLLGWMQTWPSEKWESQISVYHCTRGRWIHGSATHYMSVPRAAVALNSTKEALAALDAPVKVPEVDPISSERKIMHIGDEVHNASCTVVHLNEEIGNALGLLATELWNWDKSHAHPPVAVSEGNRQSMGQAASDFFRNVENEDGTLAFDHCSSEDIDLLVGAMLSGNKGE